MSAGFIGAGAIGQSVAGLLAATGLDVVLANSRGPETLAEVADSLGARAGTIKEAVAQDVVFLAVPWSRVPSALGRVDDWSGAVLVDATNPVEAPTFAKADLGGRTSSEVVASLAPGARVVKAFNHLAPQAYVAGPIVEGGRRVLFVSGDDASAKASVLQLIAHTGFVGIDLGGLATGGALHEFPGGPLPARNFVEVP